MDQFVTDRGETTRAADLDSAALRILSQRKVGSGNVEFGREIVFGMGSLSEIYTHVTAYLPHGREEHIRIKRGTAWA